MAQEETSKQTSDMDDFRSLVGSEKVGGGDRSWEDDVRNGSSRGSFNREGSEDADFVEVDENTESMVNMTGVRHRQQTEIIDDYRNAVERWRSGFDVSEDAVTVNALRKTRQDRMREILENDLLGDERLADFDAYISADIAELSQPDPRDGEYADYLERRGALRRNLFTGRDDNEAVDRIDNVDIYARATASLSAQMSGGENIARQYEYLSVRQEAVREHFNNPRFAVEVALYPNNLIDDELLVDLDRGDLTERTGRERSRIMADVFAERVQGRPNEDAGVVSKVQRFQELREVGRAIGHNHLSMIEFARKTQGGRGRGEVLLDNGSIGIGIQAFDDKTFSQSVLDEWRVTLSKAEQDEVDGDPVKVFQKARQTFERDYDNFKKNSEIYPNSSLAASFAVMERSAETIMRNFQGYNINGRLSNSEDMNALALFSKSYRDKMLSKVGPKVEQEVIDRMAEEQTLPDRQSSGQAKYEAKNKKGEDYQIDLSKAGKELHIEVANGNHLKLSNNATDAEQGKFVLLRIGGLVVPKDGVATKNGKFDAGEESRAHLEEFVTRYGAKDSEYRMSLQVKDDGKGGKFIDATLPSGENLSQRMIRDGYGLPTHDTDGKVRREGLAKNAEKYRRGLWADGFPEVDRDWRSESSKPYLKSSDKRDRLADTVGMAMAVDPKSVGSKLSRPETKIFSLPLNNWSGSVAVDAEIDKISRTNPGRLEDIYNGNMEILKELRKRKDKLNSREKMAHDRLDMGRRAIGKSLVDHGHMDAQKVAKDGHPMMSRKGINANLDTLRPIGRASLAAGEKALDVVDKSAKAAPKMVQGIMQAVEDSAR